MGKTNPNYVARKQRHFRVRKKIEGTSEKPRLNIFRSLNHIYAQIIDDSSGVTLVAASSLDSSIGNSDGAKLSKTQQAKSVGTLVAERAIQSGIINIVFDRGGYKYHGRVKALADASREAGLKF